MLIDQSGRPAVNALAQKLATLLYAEQSYIQTTRQLMARERSFLTRGMTELGFRVFDALTNFLFARIEHRHINPPDVWRALLKNGVFVQDCSAFPGLDSRFIRFAVRRHEENERFIAAMEKTLEGATGRRDDGKTG